MKSMNARKLDQEVSLDYGLVIGHEAGFYTVETEYGIYRARPAVGCLVQPLVNDQVLLSLARTQCYILSVLARPELDTVGCELVFTGPARLRVNGGPLDLTSDQDLTLGSNRDLTMSSNRFSLHAEEGSAVVGRLSWFGRSLKAHVRNFMMVADTMEQIGLRLTQRLVNAFRYVKEHEETQSGSARHLVEETLSVQAKDMVHQAEEIAKIDAGQIHLG